MQIYTNLDASLQLFHIMYVAIWHNSQTRYNSASHLVKRPDKLITEFIKVLIFSFGNCI